MKFYGRTFKQKQVLLSHFTCFNRQNSQNAKSLLSKNLKYRSKNLKYSSKNLKYSYTNGKKIPKGS